MRTTKTIHTISAHAEGEVGDVIVRGVSPPPGETLWEQREFIASDQTLRNFMLNEPRGGVFRHVNLLVPPKDPTADAAFIIMEPEDTPPMSGSNSICVATVLLDSGIIPMTEPTTEITLEAPAGLVQVRADCRDGKAERISVRNVPSFACKLNAELAIPNFGKVLVDTAFGGDSFVIVNASDFGFKLIQSEAAEIARLGVQITDAADEQLRFTHPTNPNWNHFSFCLFAGELKKGKGGLEAGAAVAIRPGKVDRSPTGTALSARMAVLHERGQMKIGERLTAVSIIGSEFQGRIVDEVRVGDKQAIIPEISGRGWITGTHQHMLDPSDPWPEGYRLSDTWGVSGKSVNSRNVETNPGPNGESANSRDTPAAGISEKKLACDLLCEVLVDRSGRNCGYSFKDVIDMVNVVFPKSTLGISDLENYEFEIRSGASTGYKIFSLPTKRGVDGRFVTINDIACSLLCLVAYKNENDQSYGYSYETIMKMIRIVRPSAKTTDSSLNSYSTKIRNDSSYQQIYTLPDYRLPNSKLKRSGRSKPFQKSQKKIAPTSANAIQHSLNRGTIKHVACKLICQVVQTDEKKRTYGMSYKKILKKLKKSCPHANTTYPCLTLYASKIRKGAKGYEKYQLPDKRLR